MNPSDLSSTNLSLLLHLLNPVHLRKLKASIQPNSYKGIFCQFHSVFIRLRFALWQREPSQAHFSESSERGGGRREEEEKEEEVEKKKKKKKGEEERQEVASSEFPSRSYRRGPTPSSNRLRKPCSIVSGPLAMWAFLKLSKQLSHTNEGDVPKHCSLRDLPKWQKAVVWEV